MSNRRILAAVIAAPFVATAATLIAIVATGAHRRLGVTEAETVMRFPGDEFPADPTVQNDRAITIDAEPGRVWPWLAQMGQDKAGFYSFEALENMIGCEIENADRVVPEWQRVEVGDRFPLAPGMALRVALVNPGEDLVVDTRGAEIPPEAEDSMNFDFSWGFHLRPTTGADGRPATRLHCRELYEAHDDATQRMLQVVSIASAVMSWKMLRQIRELAESSPVVPGEAAAAL